MKAVLLLPFFVALSEGVAPTAAPDTAAPATSAPVTAAPATEAPATDAPLTVAPLTAAPGTAAPATFAPATAAPATAAPTAAPPTAAPTAAPNTAAPATRPPISSVLRVVIRAEFSDLTADIIRVPILAVADPVLTRDVVVLYLCPDTACPSGRCPESNTARDNAGCLPGGRVPPAARGGALLAAADHYADVDVVPPDTVTRDVSRTSLYNRVQQDLAAPTSILRQVGVQLVTTASPVQVLTTPVPERKQSDNDDDDLWMILFIVAAALVVLCLILLLFLLLRGSKNKDNPKQPHEKVVEETAVEKQEMQEKPWDRDDAPVAGKMGTAAPQGTSTTPSDTADTAKDGNKGGEREAEHRGSIPASPLPYHPTQTTQNTIWSPDPHSWEPADYVDVMYGDEWYPAQVVEQQENRLYTVNWDDGTHSRDIPAHSIRKRI